jgi:zinc transporter ZupT
MLGQSVFFWIAVFAVGAMVVNGIGIYVIFQNKVWAERNKEYFMCFAAGVLVSSPLIMAFPQAIQKNPNAGLAALGGFVFMLISNKLIRYKTKQEQLAFGITALEGIAIHSLIDGIIYSVTFSVSMVVGLISGIGLVVHEFAEGVITFSVLVKGGVRDKRALLYAFLVAGVTTPIGAFVAYPFITRFSSQVLGLALGFVVGVLIYISAAHLLPEARKNEREHSYLALFSGMVLSLLMMLTK